MYFSTKNQKCSSCNAKLQPETFLPKKDEVVGLCCPWCSNDETQGLLTLGVSPDTDSACNCTTPYLFVKE